MRIRITPYGLLALLLLVVVLPLQAQQLIESTSVDLAVEAAQQSQTSPATIPAAPPAPLQSTHQFWDRENGLLFMAVGAGRALDYASTLNLRRRRLDEILLSNSVVDNHALFGGIEAASTVASIGFSYLFHRTGHHRLERWTSAIHFGVAVGGAVRNYALKTPHPN